MNLCLAADRRPGSRVSNQWWEKYGLDLEGTQTAARETEWMEREEDTDGTEKETD